MDLTQTIRRTLLLATMTMMSLSALQAQHKDSAEDDKDASQIVVPHIDQAKVPALIMIIRHAEKPEKALHSPDLTEVGRQRAATLPNLFAGPTPAFPKPDYLFATAVSKNSRRPIETATPLAQALGEKLNIDYGQGEAAALAHEILGGRYAGKVVFICWHHGEIPALAADLGIKDPPKWMGEIFDQVWSIHYTSGSASMSTASEMLLPGDVQK